MSRARVRLAPTRGAEAADPTVHEVDGNHTWSNWTTCGRAFLNDVDIATSNRFVRVATERGVAAQDPTTCLWCVTKKARP